jgi:Short C-terminal domain
MPGLVRAMARTAVVAGTATAVSNRVSRRQAGRWSEQAEQQEMEAQQAAPPPAAPPDEPDYMAELQQLAQLKEQGIVSEEEFEAKKKQLLGL